MNEWMYALANWWNDAELSLFNCFLTEVTINLVNTQYYYTSIHAFTYQF